MNTTFYFENKAQAEQFSRELRKCFILSVVSGTMVEIYNFALIKEECKKDVLGMARKIYKEVVSDMTAQEKLEKMTLQECIDLWNDSVDQYHQLTKIQPMENEEWWNYLAPTIGVWDFMHQLWNSGERFNDSDRYFVYIEDACEFVSFSTKQELVELMGEFFIDELTNRAV